MRVPCKRSSCAFCRRLRSKFSSRTGGSATVRFASMGTGRSGRSAWPPSRGVTSKSPMNARVGRQARQRRRCYQSGKGKAANRRGPGCRRAHRLPVWSARNRPRPEPRQRPGPAYGLVLLGDPPSFYEDVLDPHFCVKPPRCSCPAVACGDRGVSESTWADDLLFGADGVAVTCARRWAGRAPSLTSPTPKYMSTTRLDSAITCDLDAKGVHSMAACGRLRRRTAPRDRAPGPVGASDSGGQRGRANRLGSARTIYEGHRAMLRVSGSKSSAAADGVSGMIVEASPAADDVLSRRVNRRLPSTPISVAHIYPAPSSLSKRSVQ